MKRERVLCLVLALLVGYAWGAIATTSDSCLIKDRMKTIYLENFSNQTALPVWTMNDIWIYDGDVFFMNENMSFDGMVTNVAQNVVDVMNLAQNDTIPLYAINISGEINGILTYEWITGDLDGTLNGWMHLRITDLSLIEMTIWSTGTIYVGPLPMDYGFSATTVCTPPLENYDFPLALSETWGIFSNISSEIIFTIGDIVNETYVQSGPMNGMMECLSIQNVSVPGGIFESFEIDSQGNGTLTYWFSPIVKNSIKTLVNFSSDNSTLDLELNLTSYSLMNQPINITQILTPPRGYANEHINISGCVSNYSSGNPILNAPVFVRLPYTGQTWETWTNETGCYSVDIAVPLFWDSTPTNSDIGSDGITAKVSWGVLTGYTVQTLTVLGLKNSFLFSPNWNLITVPIENNWTAETLGQNISSCSVVTRYDGGAQIFSSHVVGTPWDDFPIENGVGYFLFLANSSNLTVRGIPIRSVSVNIYPEWNIIGWYQNFNTTAEELGESIANCSVVIKFDKENQIFVTHVVGTPWDNFTIKQGMGIFLYTTGTSIWHGERLKK